MKSVFFYTKFFCNRYFIKEKGSCAQSFLLCSKNIDPNKILLNAYSTFATSNDPKIRALYQSFLERESQRIREKGAGSKNNNLRKQPKFRVLNSILTDFYAGRY